MEVRKSAALATAVLWRWRGVLSKPAPVLVVVAVVAAGDVMG